MKIINQDQYSPTIHNIFYYSDIKVFKPDPIEYIDVHLLKNKLTLLLCNKFLNYDVCTIITDYLIAQTSPVIISIICQLKLYKHSYFLTFILTNSTLRNILDNISIKLKINVVIFQPQDLLRDSGSKFYIDTFTNKNNMYKHTFLIFSNLLYVCYHLNYRKHVHWFLKEDNPIIIPHNDLQTQKYMINIDEIDYTIHHSVENSKDFNEVSYYDFLNDFVFEEHKDILDIFRYNNIQEFIYALIYICVDLGSHVVLIFKDKYYGIGYDKYIHTMQIGEILDGRTICISNKSFIKDKYEKGSLRDLIFSCT